MKESLSQTPINNSNPSPEMQRKDKSPEKNSMSNGTNSLLPKQNPNHSNPLKNKTDSNSKKEETETVKNDMKIPNKSYEKHMQLKNDHKQNKLIEKKKEILIASRLHGNHQDQELKQSERLLNQLDMEITRLRLQQQSMKKSTITVSSVLIDSGQLMPLNTLKNKIELLKKQTKEKVRNRIN
jgi:hypothetical protein